MLSKNQPAKIKYRTKWVNEWTYPVVHFILCFAEVFQGFRWTVGAVFAAASWDSLLFKVKCSIPVRVIFYTTAMQLYEEKKKRQRQNWDGFLWERKQRTFTSNRQLGIAFCNQWCHRRCFKSPIGETSALTQERQTYFTALPCLVSSYPDIFVYKLSCQVRGCQLTVLWMASTATLLLSVLL